MAPAFAIAKKIKGASRRISSLGFKYHCPLCGFSLRKFVPLKERYLGDVEIPNVNYSPRNFETLSIENYDCPICWSNDRERLYFLWLRDKLKEIRSKKIVHFAPEVELSKRLRKEIPNYRTADLYRETDDRVNLADMKLYGDESFDYFICSHILEHVPEDHKALSELYRITKKGGWGILMVPILLGMDQDYEDPSKTTEEERLRHFGQEDHVRVYSKSGFIKKVESVGFRLYQLTADCFGAAVLEKHGVSPQSVLYIAEKV